MSYDIDVTVDHGDGYTTTVYDGEITFNVRTMLVEAGLPDSLRSLDSLTAAEAQDQVYEAWKELRTRPSHYRPLQASNGWGTYDQLVPWIKELYIALRTHPRGVVHVS